MIDAPLVACGPDVLHAWGLFHQHIYEQLLHLQLPKVQEFSQVCQYLFMLLGSTGAKAVRRTLMKLTPGPGGQ